MATKAVWETYVAGRSYHDASKATKIHAMVPVRHSDPVWYRPLCGANYIARTLWLTYDGDSPEGCQRCARLRRAVDVEV